MLVYHQVIYCEILANHLMCPIKSRMSGININELPRFLSEDPDDNTNAIIVNYTLNPNQPLIIQLILKGVTSYFPSRKPIEIEYEDESIPHIDMTSEAPVWEPYEVIFGEQEDVMTYFRG